MSKYHGSKRYSTSPGTSKLFSCDALWTSPPSITAFGLPALLRPAQVPGRYIASASQVLVSALERRYDIGSLAHRAGSAIACGSAWQSCSWQLWHTPATAKLHKAALPSVPVSQSQAPFVAPTASRPLGEGNRLYAKLL